MTLRGLELPVAYPRALEALAKAVEIARPEAVVAFGIHRSPAHAVRIETVAANELRFRIADNDGRKRRGRIEARAPASLRTPLPPRALEGAIRERGLSVRCSTNAGRFLCNAVYFWLLRNVPRAVFVHVPPRGPEEALTDTLAAVDGAATEVARLLASSGSGRPRTRTRTRTSTKAGI